jgi:tetratricopeptide (TPR) repeat protein
MSVFKRRNEPDKEVAEGQAAVAANPKSDMAHILLAVAYMRAKRPAEGMAEFDKAIAIKPTAAAYAARAENRPDSELAARRADLATAIKVEPNRLMSYSMLARIDLRARAYPAAIATATAGLAIQPDNIDLMIARGIAYQGSGRKGDAARSFAAARSAAGSDPVGLNELCWSKAIYDAALTSALEDCDASLRAAPDLAAAMDSRGFVLFRLGRYAEALVDYDKAIAARPRQAESLYVRGLVKRHLGKSAEGDADVAAARAIDADVPKQFADYGVTG